MGLIELLKKTPLRPLYWKILKLWPIRPIRKKLHAKHKDKMLFEVLPAVYEAHRGAPVDPRKVILIEPRLGKLSNNYFCLYRYLKDHYDLDIHVHLLRENFVKPKLFDANCEALMEDLATASMVFLTEASSVVSCVQLRPETVVVQLWHACGAFKRFGLSTAEKRFGPSLEGHMRHPMYKNYSFVSLSSPEIIWAYAEAMGMEDQKEKFKAYGTSRTDIFFEKGAREKALKKLYKNVPAAEGKKVILFAPTFRGRVSNAKTVRNFDYIAFAEAFSDEYVLVTKHHPLVRRIPAFPEELQEGFAFDVSETMDIEDLLMVSDICISDYSSLVFEYALFERPMLFYAYDLESYFDWRGFYYPYDEMAPGPVCETCEEMIEWIRHVDENFDRQRVIDFRNKFMAACDGHATERIVEAAIALRDERLSQDTPATKYGKGGLAWNN